MHEAITNNLDLWTSALLTKSTAGRGSNGKQEAYGIKKLRELILELAVRGKLVPQDPNDEQANVLLKKIAEERDRLAREGTIKKPKELPAIKDEEKPFELPKGWEYVRLNDLGEWGAGATPLRNRHDYYGGEIPWFKSGELVDDYISESEERVTKLALKETSLRYNKPGDVLIAMYGATIGKTSILKVAATTNQAVCACTPFAGFTNTFLLTLLKAYKNRFVDQGAGGAQPNISREKIIATVIALPPTAEQHRIVAKVDELMTLCDQLEQQQTHSIEAHQILVEILLGTLTRVESQQELTEAWTCIANYFDTLFTTEHSIDQLKQTILQLAVMGKLVPQDPNDEPASVLLKKIAEEKDQLIKEGTIKEQSLPVIDNGEELFPLLEGWKWERLGAIATFENGDRSSRYPNSSDLKDTGIPFFGAQDMVEGKLRFDNGLRFISQAKFNELSNGKLVDKDIVMLLRGTVGKMATFRESSEHKTGFINAQMLIIRLIDKAVCEFFNLYSSSNFFFSLVEAKTTGTAVRQMPAGVVAEFLVPIPPLKEQYRIVAKVDELMACVTPSTRASPMPRPLKSTSPTQSSSRPLHSRGSSGNGSKGENLVRPFRRSSSREPVIDELLKKMNEIPGLSFGREALGKKPVFSAEIVSWTRCSGEIRGSCRLDDRPNTAPALKV